MMKKYLSIILIALIILTGCTKSDSALFKADYESLNGKTNKNGKIHRTITIPKDNPIVLSSAKEIVSLIDAKESFYVYFGSKLCPWCRSVIEKALEIANYNGIDKIYYVDIWDENGEEILRDKYDLDADGNPTKIKDGTPEYYKLLATFNDLLRDYTYEENGETKSYGVKRIYAPNFIYVKNGKISRLTSGKSSLQKDAREELTEEMLKEEEKQFDDFFISVCDDDC